MSRKLTTEQFIFKACQIHDNQYDYSQTKYIDAYEKIIIICSNHGKFKQSPHNHLSNKNGCPKCGSEKAAQAKRLNFRTFIERARISHKNYYDYSKVKYVDMKTKIHIICLCHGGFYQLPGSHLQGHGCPSCKGAANSLRYRFSLNHFIKRANKVHNSRYDYSQSQYVNSFKLIIIGCKKHGFFKQTPSDHLSGRGCKLCGIERKARKFRSNKATFVSKSNIVHNNCYSYDKVKYNKNAHTSIIIMCKKHGDFRQKPANHLQGQGCPKCNQSKGEKSILQHYLLKHNIPHKYQYPTDQNQRIDFFLIDKNVAIEYNGEQHYTPCTFGSKKKDIGAQFLKNTIRLDRKKKRWCEEKGILLVVIPFWEYFHIDMILGEIMLGKKPQISKRSCSKKQNEL